LSALANTSYFHHKGKINMSAQMTGNASRERGGCLTVYLLLIVIGSVFSLVSAFSLNATLQQAAAQGIAVPTIPSWYAPASILPVILSLVGAVGTWTWKKWGVYVLAASLVLSAVLAVLAGQIVTGLIALVIGGGLLWYVLRNKMAMFE
jgi:hypothetical protein